MQRILCHIIRDGRKNIMQDDKLIKLEIAMDYQVNWEFERILRDLIQNFYDSIGFNMFKNDFVMEVEKIADGSYSLIMKTYGRPFSYEWLTSIGGSTKTDSPGKYIGMYGEGFKVCALCLKRQGKSISMESDTWKLEVCTYKEKIAGEEVEMLGYYLQDREDDGWTVLKINGLSGREIALKDEAVLSFYYPENPLFGSKLAEGEQYAIYKRSSVRIPCKDYVEIPGILYCNYLARGRLPIDLVILIKQNMRESDSRNRKVFDTYNSIILLNSFVEKFDAETSYKLLIYLKKYWNDMPGRIPDIETFYYIICQLVRNVASNKKFRDAFTEEYNNLVYIEKKGIDRRRDKVIDAAYKWSKDNPLFKNCMFVNPIFRLMGAVSVVEKYLESESEYSYSKMDRKKSVLVNILFDTFESIYPYEIYEERPEIVISNADSINPMQYFELDYRRKRNGRKYRINRVLMREKYFECNRFKDAFMEFSRILLHVYGTDRSAKMNAVLTNYGGFIADNFEILVSAERLWQKTCGGLK